MASSGIEGVLSGGTASDTIVSSGGFLELFRGAPPPGRRHDADVGRTHEIISGYAASGAGTAGTSQINFATGTNGTLELENSQDFHCVISAFGVRSAIDLRDISFLGSGTTLGYNDQGTSGTLTISDGAHIATLNLLEHYVDVAGNFVAQADGNGGTLITDPPVVGQYSLYNPHA